MDLLYPDLSNSEQNAASINTGDFVTSSYCYDAYPEWVSDWNNRCQPEGYADKSWSLLHDPSSYLLTAHTRWT